VEPFDVVVVGAGHAGLEAALASARMGRRTACVTLDLSRIGHLPCNCSIGGPAKGHIAREVDALGGEMAVATDHTMTHLRRVGTGKGPAVQTLRAHVCKRAYPAYMQTRVRTEPNLSLVQGQVESVAIRDGRVVGVVLREGAETRILGARAAVLTTGTFLNGLCHEGTRKTQGARHGDLAVAGLSAFLADLGVRLRRFKTGTTPRVRLGTLRLERTDFLPSEPEAGALSFLHDRPFAKRELYGCWQTRTSPATHELLAARLHESAMYAGRIEGVGPRYCPSIEDKIVRFADKESHPIFLEIEEWDGDSVYVQGFSTSLPAETQLAAMRTVPGLEEAEMLRPGYAVEYDMADPTQLTPALMSKLLPGLFLAGQLNGTSGYEEAAGQGIVAGINASRFALDEAPVEFPRDGSFLGVMVDDLTTKGVEDPYRMLTARAEHRLLLRHDNADQRLTPLARSVGLCSEARWERFSRKMEGIEAGLGLLRGTSVGAAHNSLLESLGHGPVSNRASLFELMRRPEFGLADVERLSDLASDFDLSPLRSESNEVRDQLELAAKYDGYLQQQARNAERQRKLDGLRIPAEFEYERLKGLSYESKEKLGRLRPATVGQASRVPGIRPTDIALLIGHLKRRGALEPA
jgi:tRNA uridine 5-carboxymethylaminomethyl modification enzyme